MGLLNPLQTEWVAVLFLTDTIIAVAELIREGKGMGTKSLLGNGNQLEESKSHLLLSAGSLPQPLTCILPLS